MAQHDSLLRHPHWENPNLHQCNQFVPVIKLKQPQVHSKPEGAAGIALHHDHRLLLHLHIQSLCRVTATVEEEQTIHGNDTFRHPDDLRWTKAHRLKPRLKLHSRRNEPIQSGSLPILTTRIFANNQIIDLKVTNKQRSRDAEETPSKKDPQWPDMLNNTTPHIAAWYHVQMNLLRHPLLKLKARPTFRCSTRCPPHCKQSDKNWTTK